MSYSIISNEELVRLAPSIASEHVTDKASGAYRQVRTLDVVDLMRHEGWNPVKVKNTRCRMDDRKEICKHEIRFQHVDTMQSLIKVGEESLQAIMTNSHDCTTSFTFRLGMFRLACTNGLVVPSSVFSEVRLKHIGFAPRMIGEVTQQLASHGQKVANNVEMMKSITLSPNEQGVFASAARDLMFDNEEVIKKNIQFDASSLLHARRSMDTKNDLWTTFNRVQENMTKGDIRYFTGSRMEQNFRRQRTRGVNNIDRDIKLNQALWTLANEMAKLKVA